MSSAAPPPRVLVVDGDHQMRRSLCGLLEGAGYAVALAGTGAEARRLASEREPALLLSELVLPDTDGLSLLAELRAVWPALPAMVLTAYPEPRSIVEAMRRGAVDYLSKPVDPDELLSICRAAMRDRHAAAEPPARAAIPPILGASAAAAALRESIPRLARGRPGGVLFVGEDGVGKTWLAQALHAGSARRSAPCLLHPCHVTYAPAIALFGADGRAGGGGALAGARGGTLILDDADRLPRDLQHRLVDWIERAGAAAPLLVGLVVEPDPRSPLLAWLGRATVPVPPLRERTGDILPLAGHFLAECNERLERRFTGWSRAAEAELLHRSWRGNVRELRAAVEHAARTAAGGAVQPEHLPPSADTPAGPPLWAAAGDPRPLREVTDAYIDHVLACTGGNRTRAARLLGVARETLRARLITRPAGGR